MENNELVEKRVAREILGMIERVCLSEEYAEYRVNHGSNGARDLIIRLIKLRYGVG